MDIDIAGVLAPVTRTVRNSTKDGKPTVTVTLTRLYDTSVDDLWDALTNARRIARWFLPIEGDLRLGGRYQLQGNAGGNVTACSPPRQFAATWEFGGGIAWIEVTVAATGRQARMTLEHTVMIDDHFGQFGPGAVGIGWDLAVMGLERYLSTGSPVDRGSVEAWMTSPNGKEFMTWSGEAWRVAHVSSGANLGDAQERSARTIAFYRGEKSPSAAHPGTAS